jgi:hypothetical protein
MTQATFRYRHGLLPGDRVHLSGDSNRMRRVVAGIGKTESETSFPDVTVCPAIARLCAAHSPR